MLVAASLTNDEWRDILASTGNKLDYPAIAEALQTLWDEQLNQHHGHAKGSVMQQHWVETVDPWYNAAWHEAQWEPDDWHESDWQSMDQFGAWLSSSVEPVENTATTAEEDPDLQEAMEAEKAAEALALDARRTWTQAQQAIAALRRDRGFGQHAGSSKGGKGSGGCFICSGPHLARDCPDRQHPQYRKGGGKQLTPAELDAYLFKGKGRGVRKGKDNMMSSWDDPYMAWEAMYNQKGKPKGLGKGGKLRSTVNVYGMDFGMDFGMLELQPLELVEPDDLFPLELFANEAIVSRTIPDGFGMLDCGATASAGPEASVKKLIARLRELDEQLMVTIDLERRPFFRYGSGRWGQAMYLTTIQTSKDPSKFFEVFALPNPTEYYQKSFKEHMLAPILVGMDFLSKVVLILDFKDGCAVFGAHNQSEPFTMPKNSKGHFMVDIGQYLIGSSSSNAQAHAAYSATMQLEVGGPSDEWLELAVHEDLVASTLDEHHAALHVSASQDVVCTMPSMSVGFEMLFNRRKQLSSPTAASGLSSRPPGFSTSVTSDGQVLQGVQDVHTSGPRAPSGSRPQGSSSSAIMLAVSRQARALSDWKQRSWLMGKVRSVCSQDRVHSPPGITSELGRAQGSHLCAEGSGDDSGRDPQGHQAHLRDGGEDLRVHGGIGQGPCHEGKGVRPGDRDSGHVEQPPIALHRIKEDSQGLRGGEPPGPPHSGGDSACQELGIAEAARPELGRDDSLQPDLANGRRCGGCRHSEGDKPGDPPELDESLGTSVPELQIELDTKKVQFSATSAEVHEFDATALTSQETSDPEHILVRLWTLSSSRLPTASFASPSRRAAHVEPLARTRIHHPFLQRPHHSMVNSMFLQRRRWKKSFLQHRPVPLDSLCFLGGSAKP